MHSRWTIGRQAGLRRDTDFMAGKTAVLARMRGLRPARACVPRRPPPMEICTKDCIATLSYASDGDCDGGGPGAEYLG